MKYYNKTRTIEDKVTDRKLLAALDFQNQLLQQILDELRQNR